MKRLFFIICPVFVASVIFFVLAGIVTNGTGKGALQVTSVPKTHVYLDRKLLGDSPHCWCSLGELLHTGTHRLRLESSDARFHVSPFESDIYIESSVMTVVDSLADGRGSSEASILTLRSQPGSSGGILVTTFPDKTQILLDSKQIGQAPVQLAQAKEGDRVIVIQKAGYRSKTLHVHIQAGYQLQVSVFLTADLSQKINLDEDLIASSSALAASTSATATPSAAVALTQKVLVLPTSTGFLRVRAQPSLNASVSGQVTPGQSLDMLTSMSGWFEIKMGDGKTGWISSEFAKMQ